MVFPEIFHVSALDNESYIDSKLTGDLTLQGDLHQLIEGSGEGE
jgi:hypothetical protein